MTASEPATHPEPAERSRPKDLTFFIGWLVFLGVWQILLAWRFGTFFEGSQGLLRDVYGGSALEPFYAATGVAALALAFGGWNLRPWAYWLAWVFQGLVFAVALLVIGLWWAGEDSPVGWLLLDCAFGAYNVWFLTRPDVRHAFGAGPQSDST